MEESLSIFLMTKFLSSEDLTAYHSSSVGFECLKEILSFFEETFFYFIQEKFHVMMSKWRLPSRFKDRKSLNPLEIPFNFHACAKFLKSPS